jgi:hypothetical protein
VTISRTTAGATIRYTSDGFTPAETNGTVGTSVSIGRLKTLKAIVYKSGLTRIRHGTSRGNRASDGRNNGNHKRRRNPMGKGKEMIFERLQRAWDLAGLASSPHIRAGQNGEAAMTEREPNSRGGVKKKVGLVSRMLRFLAGACVGLLALIPHGLGQNRPSKMPALVIAVRPYGFEPAALGQAAGKVMVIVDNRSGSPQLAMHLKAPTGLPVYDFPVLSGRHHWQELVTLTPGTYTLVEDGHNKWVCRITIK